jgi:hypothetical protein
MRKKERKKRRSRKKIERLKKKMSFFFFFRNTHEFIHPPNSSRLFPLFLLDRLEGQSVLRVPRQDIPSEQNQRMHQRSQRTPLFFFPLRFLLFSSFLYFDSPVMFSSHRMNRGDRRARRRTIRNGSSSSTSIFTKEMDDMIEQRIIHVGIFITLDFFSWHLDIPSERIPQR